MLAALDWPLDTFSNMSCVPWPKAEECRPWLGLRGSWYLCTHYPRAKPVFISRLLFPRSATIRTRSYLVPFVIGTNREIGDKAAIAFAVGFYQALGVDLPFSAAFEAGRTQMRLLNIPEHLSY